ncbi:MAG: protein-L-isoaspartate O-methyltransferase [Campylobacterales bacterium]
MASSHRELIADLCASGVLRTLEIIEAFEACDRRLFLPNLPPHELYGDYPIPIGEGQTNSQPTTVAIMLEMLQPHQADTVLDIGSGSGWTTALLSHIVGQEGSVIGVEIRPELVALGRRNLLRAGVTNAQITEAFPGIIGFPGRKFDKILVSASAPSFPYELLEQIKPGGRIVLPIGHSLWSIDLDTSGNLRQFELPGFSFVPLIVR